jgi:hypothetical protein
MEGVAVQQKRKNIGHCMVLKSDMSIFKTRAKGGGLLKDDP